MLNSLNASPSLSTDHVPASAPFCNILNISSAEIPAFANWTEYSLIVSNKSSFLFRPFCAPCAIKLYASWLLNPNWSINIFAALNDSFSSKSNVSFNRNASSVTCFKLSPSISPICCTTCVIASPTSSMLSPKLSLKTAFRVSPYSSIFSSEAPVAAWILFIASTVSPAVSITLCENSLILSTIADNPASIASDVKFALNTSPNVLVSSSASSIAFPYSSIEVAQLSVLSSASCIYLDVWSSSFSRLLSSTLLSFNCVCHLFVALSTLLYWFSAVCNPLAARSTALFCSSISSLVAFWDCCILSSSSCALFNRCLHCSTLLEHLSKFCCEVCNACSYCLILSFCLSTTSDNTLCFAVNASKLFWLSAYWLDNNLVSDLNVPIAEFILRILLLYSFVPCNVILAPISLTFPPAMLSPPY